MILKNRLFKKKFNKIVIKIQIKLMIINILIFNLCKNFKIILKIN
jgi:hypothetical protein